MPFFIFRTRSMDGGDDDDDDAGDTESLEVVRAKEAGQCWHVHGIFNIPPRV